MAKRDAKRATLDRIVFMTSRRYTWRRKIDTRFDNENVTPFWTCLHSSFAGGRLRAGKNNLSVRKPAIFRAYRPRYGLAKAIAIEPKNRLLDQNDYFSVVKT